MRVIASFGIGVLIGVAAVVVGVGVSRLLAASSAR